MTTQNPEISQTISVAGVNTNYHDQGEGEPLVLIHGSGPGVTAWANWRGVIPELSKHYRVIAPDMAGFGYTETPANFQANTQSWVAQLIGLLDALGLSKVKLIGNSFGGAIALHAAFHHPERFSKLVLMGAVGTRFPITEGLDKVWGYEPSFEAMSELLHLFAYNQSIITDDLIEMRYRASVRETVHERFSALFPAPRQEGVDRLALDDNDLAGITLPTAVIHGVEDRIIPFAVSQKLAKLLPNAKLHPIEQCGHWVQIEKAPEFLAIVTEFLA